MQIAKITVWIKTSSFEVESKIFNISQRKKFQTFEENLKKTEKCIYVRHDRTLILGFYVDDGVLLGKDLREMNQLIEDLKREFEISGQWTKVRRHSWEWKSNVYQEKQKLTQENYSLKILKKFKINESKSTSTPLVKDKDAAGELTKVNYPCREAIGSLLYLTNKTRPDLAQAVGFGSRYVNNPRNQNLIDLKRMFRYLNGTWDQGISFSNKERGYVIDAYCDADYARIRIRERAQRVTSYFTVEDLSVGALENSLLLQRRLQRRNTLQLPNAARNCCILNL